MEVKATEYDKLVSTREPYLTRARRCAELTIPSVFPQEGDTTASDFVIPYQGTGARAVKSLASKLLTALFPANTNFFQLIPDNAKSYAASQGDLAKGLADIERMVGVRVEQKAMRTPLYEALKQLIIGGNTLLYIGKDKVRVFRLDKYVVQRDGEGDVYRTIVKERLRISALPEATQTLVKQDASNEDYCDVFTYIERQPNGSWKAHQKADGHIVEGSASTYPKGKNPWLALRMLAVDGEDYGRSYAEEHIGDLYTLEMLSKALTEGTLAASRVLFLVRANSTINIANLKSAPNGGFVQGSEEEVKALQLNKYADFSVAANEKAELERNIAASFMMVKSAQRNAERVTAEEFRTLTAELEATLGGVYSLLATELQLPLVSIILARLEKENQIDALPDGIKPHILTGVDALGRSAELSKIGTLFQYLQPLGQDAIAENVNVDELVKRLAAALGMDTEKLVPTAEEKEAKAKQAQEQQMMQQAVPQMMKA